MRISLKVCVSVALVLICSVKTSLPASPEDLEGSSNDLDSLSSGSGDWSEDEDNTIDWNNAKNARDGTGNPFDGSSVMTFDKKHWLSEDNYVILANKKTLLESKEVLDGVIAGAVTGVILAITVAAILIYRWQKKETERYILGRQRDSNEDYHLQTRDEIIVV